MNKEKNNSLIFSVIILSIIILSVLLGPLLLNQDPVSQSLQNAYEKPSKLHWFGTDKFGRDIFARVLYGGRISFLIALMSVILSMFIGIPYGLISGYVGQKLDAVLSWFINLFMAVPQFLLILVVIAVIDENTVVWVILIIGLFSWMDVARLVRNQTLSIKELDYILAERVIGVSQLRILLRHILPNLIGPVVVSATLMLGNVILIESALSFIGLGIQPPTPSWGNIINDGRHVLIDGWWISVFPGAAIFLSVLCIHFIGEYIQEKQII
ncbi:ABC transporter permease [candidate division KSB1 bacterium]|nr:ABC transporter permease [candidate division KSB1 bacterium]